MLCFNFHTRYAPHTIFQGSDLFEDQSVVIHDLLFKTHPVGADPENTDLVAKFSVREISGNQREIEEILREIELSESLSPLSYRLYVIEAATAFRDQFEMWLCTSHDHFITIRQP